MDYQLSFPFSLFPKQNGILESGNINKYIIVLLIIFLSPHPILGFNHLLVPGVHIVRPSNSPVML